MHITYHNDQLEDLPRLAGEDLDLMLRATLFNIFCRQVQRSLRTDIIVGGLPAQPFIRSLKAQAPSLAFTPSSADGPAGGSTWASGVRFGSFYLFRLPSNQAATGLAIFCDPPQTMPAGSSAKLVAATNELTAIRSPLEHREAGAAVDYNGGPATGTWFDSEDTWKVLYMSVPLEASQYTF